MRWGQAQRGIDRLPMQTGRIIVVVVAVRIIVVIAVMVLVKLLRSWRRIFRRKDLREENEELAA